jgi:predicted DNA-binding transcriptional regulator
VEEMAMKKELVFTDSYGRKIVLPASKRCLQNAMRKRSLIYVLDEVIEIIDLRKSRSKKYVRLYEIAVELGISVCTVKRAFNILCKRGMLQKESKRYRIIRSSNQTDHIPVEALKMMKKGVGSVKRNSNNK